jgi:hypothetical protein
VRKEVQKDVLDASKKFLDFFNVLDKAAGELRVGADDEFAAWVLLCQVQDLLRNAQVTRTLFAAAKLAGLKET